MTKADVRAMTELAIEAGKLKSHNELLLAGCQEWKRLHAENSATIAEQQREIARLRRALHKYGNHKAGCHEKSTMDACTCGFDKGLR